MSVSSSKLCKRFKYFTYIMIAHSSFMSSAYHKKYQHFDTFLPFSRYVINESAAIRLTYIIFLVTISI
ncbi:hypothetical protein BXT97_08905 [Lactobacillus gasseri]|nr:hypothetical protein BXT97_08905 [Lactobacillus gasseri]